MRYGVHLYILCLCLLSRCQCRTCSIAVIGATENSAGRGGVQPKSDLRKLQVLCYVQGGNTIVSK